MLEITGNSVFSYVSKGGPVIVCVVFMWGGGSRLLNILRSNTVGGGGQT